MMNWEKIKSKEKIWNLILEFFREKRKLNPDYIDVKNNNIGYLETDGVHRVLRFIPIDDRFLFDFFDDQGIYCSVYCKHYKGKIWWSDILSRQYLQLATLESRKETEEQAWLKAFEILKDRTGDSNSSNK